jgi:Secretion system C-terminal sorting domain
MKKIILLLCFVITSICSAQTNTNISNFSFWDTEPYIAINPTNPNNLIAAWMRASIGGLSAAVSYSTNAGSTWSTPYNTPHLYSNFTSADVSIAFNSSGEAFLSYIDAAISNDSGYVMVAKSTTSGATWGAGVKVMSLLSSSDQPIDRPWLTIDNSGGAFNGRLYMVTKSVEAGTLPHHIWMKYSSDNGVTWSTQTIVDASIPTNLITNAMGVPTVGADGSLYIGYPSYDPASSIYPRIICMKSTDGGITLLPHIVTSFTAASALTDTLYQPSSTLSANPTVAGNIIFSVIDQRNGDPDVLSFHSNDGGITWSTSPVRVNDDAIANGVGQDMSWAGFSSTGKYAVTWRDRRNTGGISTSAFEMYSSISLDGGLSFSPNYNLNSVPSPYINIQKGNDFIGVCLDDNFIYNDWCDYRTSNTEIFFNKSPLTVFTEIATPSMQDEIAMKLFPNPTAENATLLFTVKEKDFLEITLTTMKGKLIKKITAQHFNAGSQQIEINTTDLTAGSYLVNIQTASNSRSTTLLKVKK